MRGEFLHHSWVGALLIFVLALAVLTALGVWFERKRWGAVLALFGVSGLVLYFLLVEKYLYGVYKIASVNFWIFSFFTVAGARAGLGFASRRYSISFQPIFPAAAIFATLSIIATSALLETKLRTNALNQKGYREAVALAALIGTTPTVLSVREEAANQWAVFYLASVPLYIDPYRSTMGQPEVLPFMKRAKAIDLASVKFIITDHDTALRSTVTGANLIWDGQTYSLWSRDEGNWTVTANGGTYNDAVRLNGLASTVSTPDYFSKK
jgi:hypothetical protein